MDFNQSPGGTLHLSPSHIHTLDAVSNYHIRRGLSRSPSTSRSHPQFTSARSTAMPSSLGAALPICKTPGSSQLSNVTVQDHTLDLFPPSTVKKIHRPRYTRATPLRMMSHTPAKTPSKTPLRRALSDANDQGNCPSIVNVMGYRGHGQENSSSPDGSPVEPAGTPFVKIDQSRSPFNLSLTPSRDNIARPRFSKSSPMKRGDGNILLDRSHLGSPAGKRKAITGGFDSSSPFDITSNSDRMMLDVGADRAGNDSDDEAASNDVVGTPPPAMRSFNLRRSSRIAESRPHIRSRYSVDANVDSSKSPRTHGRTRARASLDSGLPIAMFGHRDPFKNDDTFNPVLHTTSTTSQALSPIAPSPTHDAPTKKNDDALFQRPALPKLDFTRSLPIGAVRPKPRSFRGIQNLMTEERGIATPEAFKNAKPNPVPFMSTGLISKRHRNPDDMPAPPGRPGMPDTPCKKLPPGFSFETSPVAMRPTSKLHFPQPSFGTPSKPYSIHSNKVTPFGKTGSVFGSSFTPKNSDLQRRASFASIHSIDGEEAYQSPLTLTQVDSQSSADELPPTPTKGASRTESKPSSLRSKLFGREGRRPTVSTNTFLPPSAIEQQASNPSRKSSPIQGVFSSAPSTPETARSPSFPPPGGKISVMCPARRSRMQLKPLVAVLQSTSVSRTSRSSCLNPNPSYIAKTPSLSPVFTTFHSSGGGMSPKTPAEGTFNFPDPSSLSISPRPQNPSTPFLAPGQYHGSQHPETPTHRDSEVNAQLMSLTPSNHATGHDVDPDLVARFRKVEWYGRGEFSEVYKVAEVAEKQGYFSSSLGSKSSQMSLPEKVWIVKKTRTPITSTKAMQKKLREVHAMQEIGRSDQIVQLINHWDANHHLYIQLEFCEEGSLEDFLAKAGLRGRLDDFRIWKILVDLCDGIKHIHDANYIHLDLKPANVFIDFGGNLKIGDFGMAAKWPIRDDVEGEGDRRYIGPDLLQGHFDKPADIFAMGMMIFEIACNVVPPDNGTSWQMLRSGDWSRLPSLTSASSIGSDGQNEDLTPPMDGPHLSHESLYNPLNVPSMSIENADEATQAPSFMRDADDDESIDNVVHWMMSPDPSHRPTIDQLLLNYGIRWVRQRRRSGATIFEGPWGPSNSALTPGETPDHEMLDV